MTRPSCDAEFHEDGIEGEDGSTGSGVEARCGDHKYELPADSPAEGEAALKRRLLNEDAERCQRDGAEDEPVCDGVWDADYSV